MIKWRKKENMLGTRLYVFRPRVGKSDTSCDNTYMLYGTNPVIPRIADEFFFLAAFCIWNSRY